jgi:hypothetical protein
VAEARGADGVRAGVPPADRLARERDDLVRIAALVLGLLQLVDRLAPFAEPLGAHRGRADIEGEDGGHRLTVS